MLKSAVSDKMFFASLLFILMLTGGCGGSDAKKAHPVPPRDVPKYRVGKLVSREVGPGGYKVSYVTQSSPETLKDYFRKSLAAKKWAADGEARDPDGSEMMYFRKKQRLLLIYIQPQNSESEAGCNYSISETQGENPRGNYLLNKVPEEKEDLPEASPSPEKGKKKEKE